MEQGKGQTCAFTLELRIWRQIPLGFYGRSMDKKLKDPIYGYISIPVEIIKNVVDTAVFQRLRRIVQTSYTPLYSSAVHNRFVHSIGVFIWEELFRASCSRKF